MHKRVPTAPSARPRDTGGRIPRSERGRCHQTTVPESTTEEGALLCRHPGVSLPPKRAAQVRVSRGVGAPRVFPAEAGGAKSWATLRGARLWGPQALPRNSGRQLSGVTRLLRKSLCAIIKPKGRTANEDSSPQHLFDDNPMATWKLLHAPKNTSISAAT